METIEVLRRVTTALTLLRSLVDEGGVPRYTIAPGAALNSVIEEDVDPALRLARETLMAAQLGGVVDENGQ